MAEEFNFEQALSKALDEKINWFNAKIIAEILESYRLLYSSANTIMGILLQKGLITADPYRLDKKISDVGVPEEGEFPESEKNKVIGVRLSDYERMLDFLCNYFKFSINNLTLPRIKKFIGLNNYFQWDNLVATNKHSNTKSLASLITTIRQGSDVMSINIVNDAVSTASKALVEINGALKQSSDLQRELYKMEVRRNVIANSSFSWEKETSATVQKIKKMFPSTMGKQPFYPELVEEIVLESVGSNATQKQQELLSKLQIVKETKEKKKVQVNTKSMIMEAVRNLASMAPQLELVVFKLKDNHELVQDQRNTALEKFKSALRKAFGLKTPVIEYTIPIVDIASKTSKSESVSFNQSVTDISKRLNFYNSLTFRESPSFQKMESQPEAEIYSFLTKQLSECQQMLSLLMGYDKFFKNEVEGANKSKVKGLSMEITAIKNTMIKTNQRKAEYAAYIEEQQQMRRLGILDED